MARREYIYTRRCAEDGCRESKLTSYNTRKDYAEASKKYGNKKWYCLRHDPNGNNLKPDTGERRIVERYENQRSENAPHLKSLFWARDCGSHFRGFVGGNDWNAYADDFPAGTVIEVTTEIRVILPEQTLEQAATQ